MPFFRKPALLTAALVLLVPLVSPLAVFAQDAGPGVARVAYLQGDVAIQRGDGSSPTMAEPCLAFSISGFGTGMVSSRPRVYGWAARK